MATAFELIHKNRFPLPVMVALALCFGFIAPSLPSWAEESGNREDVAYSQSFEDVLPGTNAPPEWYKVFGEQGDDRLTVSNLHAGEGNQSLEYDRTGDDGRYWAFGFKLPRTPAVWMAFQYSFLYEGVGNDARFYAQWRGADLKSRLLTLGLFRVKFEGIPCAQSVWHRVTVWLPPAGVDGKGKAILFQLEKKNSEGTWECVSPPAPCGGTVPQDGYGSVLFSGWPGYRNYRVYLDDFLYMAVDPEQVPDCGEGQPQ